MYDSLGSRLKTLRLEKGLLQKDVAKRLNISDVAYGYYEKNERQPNTEGLKTLANFFDVSVDYLLGLTDIPNDKYNDLDNTLVAFSGEIRELTDDDKDIVLSIIRQMKEKRKRG